MASETASSASAKMGASAYASGNKVAFGGNPSLHTAAHEAAHVVQQRSGVSLSEGVGKAGDSYERHADAVAERGTATADGAAGYRAHLEWSRVGTTPYLERGWVERG